jgi:hypothetical protein
LKPVVIVVSAVAALALLVILGVNVYFHAKYGEFYKVAETHFTISGLSDNFISQGLTWKADGTFLTCGYMKDGSASRIYRVGKNEEYVNFETDLGDADTNHAGGITVYGNRVYLTSGESIAVYSLDAVMTAPSASSETNTAVIAVYELNRDAELGFADTVPARIYSIPGLAQGMCLTSDGKVCISASYGMADSHIYIYANPISTESHDKFLVENAEIPLYFLDNGSIEKNNNLVPNIRGNSLR